jgi:quinol monooxygenase YgiN
MLRRRRKVIVIGRVTPKPEMLPEFLDSGKRLVAASRQDPGCLSYTLYRNSGRPEAFVFLEEWRDTKALRAHLETTHVAEFLRCVGPLLATPPDVTFNVIERAWRPRAAWQATPTGYHG